MGNLLNYYNNTKIDIEMLLDSSEDLNNSEYYEYSEYSDSLENLDNISLENLEIKSTIIEPSMSDIVSDACDVKQDIVSDVKQDIVSDVEQETWENDNKYIKLQNVTPYQVLVVSPNKMEDRDWSAPLYLYNLVNDSFCNYEMIDPKDYIEKIAVFLQVNNYAYPDVKVHIISEENNFIDEIMYIDLFPEYKIDSLKNDFATLLNINGDIIYGNAIVTRTFIPSNDLLLPKSSNCDMWYVDTTRQKIQNMLEARINTKVILYDSEKETYEEVEVAGSLDKFAEIFFGEAQYTYKKMELPFLRHNINVWYSENKYGNLDVFGNILPELARVDKMIVFTMWFENYRGSITLDEFNKIKFLSKKLNEYTVPAEIELDTDWYDNINRLIVKNKYRILNTLYILNKEF